MREEYFLTRLLDGLKFWFFIALIVIGSCVLTDVLQIKFQISDDIANYIAGFGGFIIAVPLVWKRMKNDFWNNKK